MCVVSYWVGDKRSLTQILPFPLSPLLESQGISGPKAPIAPDI